MPEAAPEGGRDAYTRDRLQRIADLVDEELPAGWGFVLLCFPFGDAPGRMNYVSNAQREDVIKGMEEFLDNYKHFGGFGSHVPNQPEFQIGEHIGLRGGSWQVTRVEPGHLRLKQVDKKTNG